MDNAEATEDLEVARVARQLRILARLTDMAMDLAEDAHRAAKADPTPANKAVFDRVSRTVRQCLALETWIVTGGAAAAIARAERRAAADLVESRQRKREIRAEMVRNVQATPHFTGAQRHRLETYLMGMVMDAATLRRPIAEIIADICRSLGIPPDPEFSQVTINHDPALEPVAGIASG